MDWKLPDRLNSGCIICVTGPSGSGKSTLLELLREWQPNHITPRLNAANHATPLIDAPGQTPEQTIRMLTSVGLGDPFSWCRTPAELSEGQMERLLMAAALHEPGYIIMDEWLARLDRVTAQAVAWTVGKRLREQGRGGVFCTSHDDLVEYLRPDVWVQVDWNPEPAVAWMSWDSTPNPLLTKITFEDGNKLDWKALKHLHYAAGDPATYAEIYAARLPGMGHPAAVAVLSYPDLHSAARSLATDGQWDIRGSSSTAKDLNRKFRRLSRIVVAPELRSCGIAGGLIEHACTRTAADFLECTTAMGKWTNFLGAAGFTEHPNALSRQEAELMDFAEQAGFPSAAGLGDEPLDKWIESMSVRDRRRWKRLVWRVYHHLVLHRRTRTRPLKRIPADSDPRWAEATDVALRRIQERPTYWIRPTRAASVRALCQSDGLETPSAQPD